MNKLVWIALLLAVPIVASADYTGYLVAIEATVGGPTTFVMIVDSNRVAFTSTSGVVQSTLVSAFLSGAKVTLETEGTTHVIHRVDAFETGGGLKSPASGDYRVNRLATQRAQGAEYLEVFLVKKNQETQFLVYDANLQPLFVDVLNVKTGPGLAFVPVQIQEQGKIVYSVRIGEAPR